MSNREPYIIITNGATGSGKSKLICETIKHLKLHEEYIPILIDDLVEQNTEYKKKVTEIIDNIKTECESREECINSKYKVPSDELLKKFNNAYFSIRSAKNCVKDSEETCDEYNNKKLRNAFSNNANVVFETQGNTVPKWLLNDAYLPKYYKVIFSYSLVTLDNLVNRNINRVLDSITLFQRDNNRPGPRLPDVRKHVLAQKVNNIITTLKHLILNCLKVKDNKSTDFCPDRKIDNLLIFDNNETVTHKMFDISQIDSVTKDGLDKLLEKYVTPAKLLEISSGNKKKKQTTTPKTKLPKTTPKTTPKTKLPKTKLPKTKLPKTKLPNTKQTTIPK